ncbi:MAG: type II secretion system F family protein [Pseudomonadota bacterium]
MPDASYKYVAENADGKIVRGRIEAISDQAAIKALRASALSPIEVRPAPASEGLSFGLTDQSLPNAAFARIARKLADLLGAGVPLRDALRLCANQERQARPKAFLERVTHRVSSGAPLSKAFQEDEVRPPRLVNALTLSAERTGRFAENFERLAASLEATEKFQKEIIGQLIYPLALTVLIALTLIFLSFFVLPQFEGIFETAAAAPPAATQFVLSAGAAIRAYWQWTPFVVLLVLLGARLAARYAREELDLFVLSLPIVGPLILKMETGRFCRSLGVLTVNGAPLADALPVAAEAIGSPKLRRTAKAAENAVRSGKLLSPAMADTGAPQDAVSLIEIGERTGRLGDMLLKAAEQCEADVTTALKSFAALLGPLMTALMGLIVAGVIASVMVGVLSLNDAIY